MRNTKQRSLINIMLRSATSLWKADGGARGQKWASQQIFNKLFDYDLLMWLFIFEKRQQFSCS